MAHDWYCQISGQVVGPLTAAKLKKLADSGNLKQDDQVRQTAEGKWVAARKVKGLFAQTPTPSQTPSPVTEVYGVREPDAGTAVTPATPPVNKPTTQNACEYIPESVARENRVFPLRKEGNVLTILASDLHYEVVDKLRFILNCEIEVIDAPAQQIQDLINQHYKSTPDDTEPLFPAWMTPFK